MVGYDIAFPELYKHVCLESSSLFNLTPGGLIMATVATNKMHVLCHERTAQSHGPSSLTLQENGIRPQSSEMSRELLFSIERFFFHYVPVSTKTSLVTRVTKYFHSDTWKPYKRAKGPALPPSVSIMLNQGICRHLFYQGQILLTRVQSNSFRCKYFPRSSK